MAKSHSTKQGILRAVRLNQARKLSLRDRNVFLKLMQSNAKPNKALKDAAVKYKVRRA